jgi:TonB-dependent starch-binding outer membrane protein SusC
VAFCFQHLGSLYPKYTHMIKPYIYFLLFLSSIICFQLPAQVREVYIIQGEVRDSVTGESLVGVNVSIEGAQYGVITDASGLFTLKLTPGNCRLAIAYIGYETKVLAVNADRDQFFFIMLKPLVTQLDEVKITAQKKFFGNMEYGREIPSISADMIEKENINNTSDILHARLAGVWAVKTSGAPGDHEKIRIRGQNSFFSSAEPLYVVDGVPVPIVNLSSLGIADLNIHDIENVTVLRDPSSTALYGFQGGNGVVLIDTKRGEKNEINFFTRFGYQRFDHFYDLMSAEEQILSLDSAYRKVGVGLSAYYPKLTDSLCNHNRQDELFSPGFLQEYQLSASGKKDLLKYYVSGNYTDHKGILPHSEYTRYTFSSHVSRNFWKKLAVDLSYRGSIQQNADNQDQYQGNRIIWETISRSPSFECTPDSLFHDETSTFNRILSRYDPLNSREPIDDIIGNNRHTLDIKNNIASVLSRLQINEHLSMDLMESFMHRSSDYDTKFEFNTFSSYGWSGINKVKMFSRENVILFNHQVNLSYYNSFGKHNIGTVLAHRYYKDNLWWNVDTMEGSLNEHYSLKNSMAAYGPHGSVLRNMSSYIGHFSYNYRNMYFLSVIGNVSSIREGTYIHYYSFFPSMALSWDLAQLNLFRKLEWIDALNIYANWGRSGNYPLNGLANDLYEDVPYTIDGQTNDYPAVHQLANHYLRHENTSEMDLGVKSDFFGKRLSLSVSRYDKKLSDLIVQRDIPYYYGGGKMFQNIAAISVKGFEYTLEATPLRTDRFTWECLFSYSSNKQVVEKLADSSAMLFRDYDPLIPTFVIEEGQGIGDICGYKYLGQLTPEDWENPTNSIIRTQGSKFVNADSSDTVLDENDKVSLGNSIPDYTWNFSTSFSYRSIEIGMMWYAAIGQEKYNATRAATIMTAVNREANRFIDDSLRIMRYNFFYESSIFVEDASFVRLKEISIRYTPSLHVMKNGELTFAVSFENLLTITKYKGYDPEATIFTDNNFSDNSIDRGAYPNPKAVYFSIGLKF